MAACATPASDLTSQHDEDISFHLVEHPKLSPRRHRNPCNPTCKEIPSIKHGVFGESIDSRCDPRPVRVADPPLLPDRLPPNPYRVGHAELGSSHAPDRRGREAVRWPPKGRQSRRGNPWPRTSPPPAACSRRNPRRCKRDRAQQLPSDRQSSASLSHAVETAGARFSDPLTGAQDPGTPSAQQQPPTRKGELCLAHRFRDTGR